MNHNNLENNADLFLVFYFSPKWKQFELFCEVRWCELLSCLNVVGNIRRDFHSSFGSRENWIEYLNCKRKIPTCGDKRFCHVFCGREFGWSRSNVSVFTEVFRPGGLNKNNFLLVIFIWEVVLYNSYCEQFWFQLFNTCIEKSEKADNLDERLKILLNNCTNTVFENVSR